MLVNAGCTVHRCDAETSESTYLIVDGGIVGGIRISEHKGRPSAPYKYNIGAFVDTTHTTHGRIERTFYTLDDMRRLTADVVAEHEANVAEYGERKYSKMVHRALIDDESEWHDVIMKCRTLDEYDPSRRNGGKSEATDKSEARQGRAREIIHDIGNGFKYVDDAVCGNKRKRTRILYQHNYRCTCGQF